MEERESLKRQIELLQNLINKHKSVHGDTPFARDEQRPPGPASASTSASASASASTSTSVSARGRDHSTPAVHPSSSRGRHYAPESRGSWRKTYSLRNKSPQSSAAASSSALQSGSHNTSLLSRGEGDGVRTATSSSEVLQQQTDRHMNNNAGIGGLATVKKNTVSAPLSRRDDRKGGSSSTGTGLQHATPHTQTQGFQQRDYSGDGVLPEKKVSGVKVPCSVKGDPSASLQSSCQTQTKTSLTSKTSTEAVTATTPSILTARKAAPAPSTLSKVSQQAASSHTSQRQATEAFLKKSKFTWVKSQNAGGGEPQQASSISSPTGKAVPATTVICKAGPASASSSLFTHNKRTPAKKLPRKLSPVTGAPKTSKYKWVSSTAGVQAKTPRKSLSPKALTVSQRALEKGEATKKHRAVSAPSAKIKKGNVGSSNISPLSSRYRWKAGGQSTSTAVTEGPTMARRRSAFHWTAEKSSKGVKGGFAASSFVSQRTSLTASSSPSGFKLRSRMKIIRRSVSSEGGSERGSNLSGVKYPPRGRIHTSTRSPTGVRRTPSRELVSFGKHKLRRLSPTSSRTSASSSLHRSSASQRVFRTRYKMVTSPSQPPHYNPALSWRAKRIQSARSFLQSRLRAPHDRHPPSTQHWKGSSMCWIHGSLYRVSANKLSRTAASHMSINRTGKSFSSAQGSSVIPAFSRPSSTRHLASRAVQRSLAIIRHARQKKPPKQYCMYYNRFGKCNRGNSCPYIHDPDKVAVCTRFLRGTCKQADGTCPFSHKVAKEKMPVCSYFLKGICNNSDCPYSHVYVSRKAEVCEDFVKGYCPEGEKCKKKHTLVCPDFSKTGSCPRGSRCKLQHHHRAKRSTTSTSTTPAKRARTREPSKRPRLSVVMPGSPAAPGTPTKGPLALPSFISLSSSPEEADTPDTQPPETSQVKEKRLQIKPRL